MSYVQRNAADVASALGMVHDRNARKLFEELIRQVVEDCAKTADWEQGNYVDDSMGKRIAREIARDIRMLPDRPLP